jgi:hypothetical protein
MKKIKPVIVSLLLVMAAGFLAPAFSNDEVRNKRLGHGIVAKIDYFPTNELATNLRYQAGDLSASLAISPLWGAKLELTSMVGRYVEIATGAGYYRQTVDLTLRVSGEEAYGNGLLRIIPLTFTVRGLPLGRVPERLIIPYVGVGVGGYIGLGEVEGTTTISEDKFSAEGYSGEFGWHLIAGAELALSRRFGLVVEIKRIFSIANTVTGLEVEEAKALSLEGTVASFGIAYHF